MTTYDIVTENPEWQKLSCQKCVKELPYLRKMITGAAEDVIRICCQHKYDRT